MLLYTLVHIKNYLLKFPFSTYVSKRICWVEQFVKIPMHIADNGTGKHPCYEHNEYTKTDNICAWSEIFKTVNTTVILVIYLCKFQIKTFLFNTELIYETNLHSTFFKAWMV